MSAVRRVGYPCLRGSFSVRRTIAQAANVLVRGSTTSAVVLLVVLLCATSLKADERAPSGSADRPDSPPQRRSGDVAGVLLKLRDSLGGGVLKDSVLAEASGGAEERGEAADHIGAPSGFVRRVRSLDALHDALESPNQTLFIELPPWADGSNNAPVATTKSILAAAKSVPCDAGAIPLAGPIAAVPGVFPCVSGLLFDDRRVPEYRASSHWVPIVMDPSPDSVVDALRTASRQLEKAANQLERRDDYLRADEFRAWAQQIRQRARDQRAGHPAAAPLMGPAPLAPLSSLLSP